jgi:hypothetical protein
LVRIIVPMEIQQGRAVRLIKPLLSWELKAGVELALPAELEFILIREGFAEQIEATVSSQVEGK